MADLETAVNEKFAPHNASLPSDVLHELLSILKLHGLSVEELFWKWESYCIKMGSEDTQLEYKTSRDFKKDLQDALERDSRAKGHVMHSANKKTAATPRAAGGSGGDVFGMLDGLVSATPSRGSAGAAKRKANDFATPAAKSTKSGLNSSPSGPPPAATAGAQHNVVFEDRTNAGQIVESINPHLPAAVAPSEPPTEGRVKLKAISDMTKMGYRPMAMKLSEASEILDDRIDSFTEIVQKQHDLPDSAFGNPAAQSTAEIVAVGRIACDQPNGKLNAASVVLETSRRTGAGLRIPLKFSDGVAHDLFPGKIVALRGTNVSGEYFAVTEMLPISPLPPPGSKPEDLDMNNDRLTGAEGEPRPLAVMVGSGPYTTDSDLNFAALYALLDKAAEERTDMLILTGPFLDLEHPLVASGDLEPYLPADAKIEPDRATVDDVFRCLISRPLQRLTQAVPTITIVLVPSIRDTISKHVSYPQNRIPRAGLELPKQVNVLTNPMILQANELNIGISSQDVLSELRRENVYQGAKGQAFNDDLLARLCGQVIDSRHFFPVYPPQPREALPKPAPIHGEIPDPGAEERLPLGASLDLGYLKLGEFFEVTPDVLILPSVLTPFAKVLPLPMSLSLSSSSVSSLIENILIANAHTGRQWRPLHQPRHIKQATSSWYLRLNGCAYKSGKG